MVLFWRLNVTTLDECQKTHKKVRKTEKILPWVRLKLMSSCQAPSGTTVASSRHCATKDLDN